jgi:hypothetical protein
MKIRLEIRCTIITDNQNHIYLGGQYMDYDVETKKVATEIIDTLFEKVFKHDS